jgi:hypothetical protein
MKYFFSLLLLLSLAVGCNNKPSAEAELENKLKKTMKEYLDGKAKLETVATVKDVIYDDRGKYYYCEFHVNLHNANKDTTGTMVAMISKDFKTVERSQ